MAWLLIVGRKMTDINFIRNEIARSEGNGRRSCSFSGRALGRPRPKPCCRGWRSRSRTSVPSATRSRRVSLAITKVGCLEGGSGEQDLQPRPSQDLSRRADEAGADEQHKKNVREELQVLGTFREYMQRRRPTTTALKCLIAAVDAYAEQLTGNSDALWASSVDIKRWWDE